jgi:hypothetical protein
VGHVAQLLMIKPGMANFTVEGTVIVRVVCSTGQYGIRSALLGGLP